METKLTDAQRVVLERLAVPIADAMRDRYWLSKETTMSSPRVGGVVRQLVAKGLAEPLKISPKFGVRQTWKLTAEGHALLKALLELRA